MPITASMLYDLIACPHRVTMDLYADPADRDEISPFIKMRWEKRSAHEDAIMGRLGDFSLFGGLYRARVAAPTTASNRPHPSGRNSISAACLTF